MPFLVREHGSISMQVVAARWMDRAPSSGWPVRRESQPSFLKTWLPATEAFLMLLYAVYCLRTAPVSTYTKDTAMHSPRYHDSHPVMIDKMSHFVVDVKDHGLQWHMNIDPEGMMEAASVMEQVLVKPWHERPNFFPLTTIIALGRGTSFPSSSCLSY